MCQACPSTARRSRAPTHSKQPCWRGREELQEHSRVQPELLPPTPQGLEELQEHSPLQSSLLPTLRGREELQEHSPVQVCQQPELQPTPWELEELQEHSPLQFSQQPELWPTPLYGHGRRSAGSGSHPCLPLSEWKPRLLHRRTAKCSVQSARNAYCRERALSATPCVQGGQHCVGTPDWSRPLHRPLRLRKPATKATRRRPWEGSCRSACARGSVCCRCTLCLLYALVPNKVALESVCKAAIVQFEACALPTAGGLQAAAFHRHSWLKNLSPWPGCQPCRSSPSAPSLAPPIRNCRVYIHTYVIRLCLNT